MTVASINTAVDIVCPAFCTVKVLQQGSRFAAVVQTIEDELVDTLDIVDSYATNPTDRQYAESLLESCFYSVDLHDLDPLDATVAAAIDSDYKRRLLGERLMAALPGNWRSRQWCHSCPPGCCGPTSRHDRAESVRKIMELLRLVVLLWIATPALAKWNSTFPCACKLGMKLGVHDILTRGLSRLGGHRSRDDGDGELSDDAQLGARGGGPGGVGTVDMSAPPHVATRHARAHACSHAPYTHMWI
jgi:hypothetical protein